jgi:DNA polymerase III epsilon subunit family exonuclease
MTGGPGTVGGAPRARSLYSEGDDLPLLVRATLEAEPARPTASAPDATGPDSGADRPDAASTASPAGIARTLEVAASRAEQHMQRLARRRSRHGDRTPAWAQLPLDVARFCVIDLETTGTARSAEILEVGIVHVAHGEIGLEFASLVQPEQPITPASHAVHGIAPHDVSGVPRLAEALDVLVGMASGRVLVFHNAGFDLGFIQRALLESGGAPLDAPVLDTVVLARQVLGGRCGLGSAGARLGITAPHLHRALPDARLTALLLLRLLAILADAGARRLGDLPGLTRRGPRARRPALPQPLRQVLCRAMSRGERLAIDYRAAPGLVPLGLEIRPVRLAAGRLLARRDDGVDIEIDLERIDRVRTLKETA